jgi:arylsulfatase
MHLWTHLKEGVKGRTGLGIYADGMLEHDDHVGQLLELLDELKIADNTIVVYTCDNGPHYNAWPDGGITPFRGEKNTNWEGGYRVPAMVRWPGKISAGVVSNEIVCHRDWVPTLMAAVGEPDIKEKLKSGHRAAGKTFKSHLDGYNILPHLTGKEAKSPRKEFFYFNDTGQLIGLRYNRWKIVFAEQRSSRFQVWSEPFVQLRLPKFFDLRGDPYERADTDANDYDNWRIEHLFLMVPTQAVVADFVATFEEFPPTQTPAKFNVSDVLKQMKTATNN